jgi:hypothetical protein
MNIPTTASTAPSAIVAQPSQPALLKCPPEVRNMIYSLLIKNPNPIKIRSPRKKHIKRDSTAINFGHLLLINKQIRTEASSLYYSANTFVIGNGRWGSTTHTNIHALKAFTSRVPARNLSQITKLHVEVHLRSLWVGYSYRGPPWVLGDVNDASALQTISRALVRHFKRLEELQYHLIPTSGQWVHDDHQLHRLNWEEGIHELTKMVRTVLKHKSLEKNLKEVHGLGDEGKVYLQAAFDIVLKANPEFGKILRQTVKSLSR